MAFDSGVDFDNSGRKAGNILKILAAALFLSVTVAGFQCAAEEAVNPLRLCADPDNLPFSSEKAGNPGLYIEIGEAIAQELNRPMAAVWYRMYFGKRAIRSTLLAKQCDLAIGFPTGSDFMGPALIFSKPFLQTGYALVTKKPAAASSLSQFDGRTIAVQFGTTPQNLLAGYDGIRMVTRMSPEDAIKALAGGDADAAFVWGPTAGYLNKTAYSDAFNVIPVNGLGMQWPVAIALAKRDKALRDDVNAALDRIEAKISQLGAKYGFPSVAPVKLAEWGAGNAQVKLVKVASTEPALPEPASPPVTSAALATAREATEQVVPEAVAPISAQVKEGKELFNGTCAHCHGPNAEQSERRIDLRLLNHRYSDGMEEMFFKTVHLGRPAKGMPSWKDVFTEAQFTAILAYLKTVQRQN